MFMEEIAKNINDKNFAEMIDLEKFDKIGFYKFNKRENKKEFVSDFVKIKSNSWLRKIYDAYLDIYEKSNYNVEKQIWIARIAYQEKRWLLPWWFTEFIKELNKNLSKENFKKFLEVFVAYHKYFNPNAK